MTICIAVVSIVDTEGTLHWFQARVVCMSDTHSLTSHIKFEVPDGDIFIHAGDFTKCGGLEEVVDFNNWLGEFVVI